MATGKSQTASRAVSELKDGIIQKNGACRHSCRTSLGRVLLHRHGKAGFAEQDLRPRAVDLHFCDVADVRGYLYLTLLAALDFEGVERVSGAVRVDNPPGRSRCVGNLKVRRHTQDALPILDRV